MDTSLKTLIKIKENEIIKNFNTNNIEVIIVKNQVELTTYLNAVLCDKKSIAVGGSVTLDQMNILDLIRKSDVDFIDRYEQGISVEEKEERFRQAFFADVFLTSTNALTIDGCLYNIDGTGNRVAAMIYGPKQVIVIAGLNKVFEDEVSAINHIKNISAPANAIRLDRNTPCTKIGHCIDCRHPNRICSSYVKLGYQKDPQRMKLIIVEEELGY